MENEQETWLLIKQRKMLRIENIGYLKRTLVQQKLSFDFLDTYSMVIRNVGHLKMSLQTSIDSLMGNAY